MYDVDFNKFNGTPRLFLDFINFREPAARFFGRDFRDIDCYRAVASQIDKTSYNRTKLASIISEATLSFGLSAPATENIRKLAQPNTLCVFAGQQVGMLLGPMYTVLKALSAYKLAKKLESDLGRPVVPCFWMASDDHDFAEVKSVSILDRDGNCRNVSYEPARPPDGVPMAEIVLDDRVTVFLDEVESVLLRTEFRATIVSWIRDAYRSSRTVSEAFGILMERLLSSFGIVPVDPNFAGMKELFSPVFRREIENHGVIFELFERRSREIIESGYHRQVHKTADSLNLFYSDGVRRNILVSGQDFSFDGSGETMSRDGLLELLSREPCRFSPNVALRPIAQCFAIPTISQIVGPSEAAYFSQIGPLFDYHGVPLPVVRPRVFATMLEPHIAKIFRKLGIDFASLSNDKEFEVGRIIRVQFPDEIESQTVELRDKIEKMIAAIAANVKEKDLESYQALDYARRRILHELNHLSKKLFMAHKKKHEDVSQRVRKVAAFVLPCNKFQERVLSPAYLANKFGPDIFERIEKKLDINSTAHQLAEIEP
jgi:bacillithiol biosynthesis cysteine-adding enzyme BshC